MNVGPVFAMLSPPPGQSGGAGTMVFVFQIALIFVIFWFLLIRPQRQQQKKHAELLKGVKKGDTIVTSGGLVGEVVHIKDDRVTMKTGEAKVVVERERIARIITSDAESSASS